MTLWKRQNEESVDKRQVNECFVGVSELLEQINLYLLS